MSPTLTQALVELNDCERFKYFFVFCALQFFLFVAAEKALYTNLT